MATSDLLNKLSTDITDTYTSINNLGGTIPEHKNTENIAPAIESIYNKLPKVSDTGTNLNLTPTLEARLGLIPKGNTYQETYSGKNLFENKLATRTTAGITYTPVYENGLLQYINVNGTATSNSIVTLGKIDLKGGTAYTSSDDAVGSPTTFFMYLFNSSNIDVVYVWENEKTYTPPADDTFTVYFQVKNGVTLNNLKIKPMIRLSSVTDNTYEPYVGGQPSPNPSYPQMPKVVTGENSVKVENKNLFDKDNTTLGRIDTSGAVATITGYYTSDFIKVEPNTSYTKNSPTADAYHRFAFYTSDDTSGFISVSNSNTITTPSNCKYLRFCGIDGEQDTTLLVKGSSATPYVEHKEQNYQVSLGDIELVEIGDYADYIEGTPDNWVKKEEIGKVVLNGSEAGWAYASVTQGSLFRKSSIYSIANIIPISNYFIGIQNSSGRANGNVYYNASLNSLDFIDNDYTNLRDFASWLSTHNVIVYYVKSEPTDVPITDTTLINQLNALYYARSYDDETNISTSCEEGNMPMKFSASALEGVLND